MKLSEMSKTTNQTDSTNMENNINKAYNQIKDCSSDQLFKMLTDEIEKQKKDGTFDFENLKSMIEKIKIYLPTQTYQNILNILETLK